MRRVLQDGGFRSDWGNPDYDPIGDFKETAGDEYRIPLLKVLLREQLASRYEVANHFSTMNRARVELSAFIQNEGGAPLPEDALGTPEEQGIRAMLIATGEPPREGNFYNRFCQRKWLVRRRSVETPQREPIITSICGG